MDVLGEELDEPISLGKGRLMGWKRPELERMVCDCCGYSVQPEFGDLPDGTETVPMLYEYDFAEVGIDGGAFPSHIWESPEVWCDGCSEHYGKMIASLDHTSLGVLLKEQWETEGQKVVDKLFPDWKTSNQVYQRRIVRPGVKW